MPFHNRNFVLLWSGQLVSWVGTEITGITLPLVVLVLTGSPAQAGAVAAIRGLMFVGFALPAGVLIDRWDRKIVMVVANTGSGLAMGSICLALLLHHLTILQLYVAGAIEGACFVFANLARFASLPRVVPKEQYAPAMASLSVAESIAQFSGPLLGGALYQVLGAAFAFLADASSYIINAISIAFVTVKLQEEQAEKAVASFREDIREAIVWWWHQPTLRTTNLLTAGRAMIASALALLVIVLAKQHHASTALIGIIFALGSLGGLGGSLVASQLHRRLGFQRSLQVATLYSWLIFTGYVVAFNDVVLIIITAAFFVMIPLYDVTASTYSASHVPDPIRGRVTSVTRLIVLSAVSLGSVVAGFSLQFFGSFWTIGIFSALLLAFALIAVFHPAIRNAS